jgi:hypothetical protein
MGHNKTRVDYLTPLVNWVEAGTAPERLIATKHVNTDPTLDVQMTRPLCVYPREARYSGSGDSNVADNWVCVDDGKTETAPPLPAPEYLAPLRIEVHALPPFISSRFAHGLITAVLSAPGDSADFREWLPGDLRLEGAMPVSVFAGPNGRTVMERESRRSVVFCRLAQSRAERPHRPRKSCGAAKAPSLRHRHWHQRSATEPHKQVEADAVRVADDASGRIVMRTPRAQPPRL